MTICIVDTSVFCELLDVPRMNEHRAAVLKELRGKEGKEWLFLPTATIVETGNHIGKVR